MALCGNCAKVSQGWEVRCLECGQLKWPYLPEKPMQYVCVLCRSGAGAGKKESGRKGAAAKAARRKQQEATGGSNG